MTSAQTSMYPPSRAASFQRMLDLEKKYKLERFQTSPQHSTASSPIAESFNGYPQYQVRSDDSLSHCQNDLMLKAVRRNAAHPSLSITIPPPRKANVEARAAREMEPEHEDEYDPDLENAEPEPLQKSVKFLAPDSDSDDESVQSSICQSPSWEGYGQKKKEKKKEAERKRKEREQAEREAKAARKKPLSRLSKAPPVSMKQTPTLMERSNSAPILESHRSFAPSRAHQLAAVQDETELEDEMSDSSSVTPDAKDFIGHGNNRFLGELKFEQERKAAAQISTDPRFPPSFRGGLSNGYAPDPRQPMHKSHSAGPRMDKSYLGQAASTRQGFKTPREMCPPSASRTPQLRHMPPDHGLSRSHSLLQSSSKMFRDREASNQQVSNLYSHTSHSQESLHTTDLLADRSRPDEGYVRRQRDQNAERAMADLEDEHLSYSMGLSAYSTTRMSSQQPSRSRDVKAAATKPSSRNKTPPAVASRHGHEPTGEHGDYFTLAGPEYSQLPQDGPAPTEDHIYTKGKGGKQVETPPAGSVTSQDLAPTSSSGSSTTESGHGVIRNLKDAAIAALHRSPAQPPSTAVKIPPYLALRMRMSSSNSTPAPAPAPPTVQTATVPVSTNVPRPPKAAHGEYANANGQNPHPESRVSEGSSSSSNYDDVSPLPSPATTPDTSRPQSAKGVHPTVGEASREGENLTISDDQRTVRQSSEASSRSDSPSVTPRAGVRTGEDMADEDRWSRTAMPMDIDFDTPEDEVDGEDSPQFGESDEAVIQPLKPPNTARTRLNSGISLSAVGPRPSPPLKDEAGIPRRSKARDAHPKTSPGRIQFKEADKEPEKEPGPEPESESRHNLKQQRRLRKQKPEIEHKPVKELSDDAISIRSVSTISKSTNVAASTSASMLSARFMSPIGGFVPSYGFASNPFFVDISELKKTGSDTVKVTLPLKVTTTEILLQGSAPPRGRVLPADEATAPRPAPAPKQTRVLPAPEAPKPAIKSTSSPPPAATTEAKVGPPSKPTTPVSILKPTPPPQPMPEDSQNPTPGSKPPVLSAIPKHLQSQTSARGAVATTPEGRKAPIAKMFVECCSCRFYHDMPSKLYECMAKPDAMVEDRNLGISGAITTMVKCPWCQHNMSTKCCAGYAAVVYVKEKLH